MFFMVMIVSFFPLMMFLFLVRIVRVRLKSGRFLLVNSPFFMVLITFMMLLMMLALGKIGKVIKEKKDEEGEESQD